MNQRRKTALEIALIILIGVLLLSPLAFVFSKRQAEEEREKCISQMQQFSGAIKSWSLENKKRAGEVVQANDIADYQRNRTMPVCPSGGTYQMRVGSEFYGDVSCSVHGQLP